MQLIRTERDSHWYDSTGAAKHTVESAKGELRPTTLRDAKKHGWLPSVTTFLKVFANDGLVTWQRTQDILAAITLPRKEGEDDQAFAARVVEDSEAYMYKKAAWGTKVHAVVEQVNRDKSFQTMFGEPELNQVGATYNDWFNANVDEVFGNELRLVNMKLGYAGTCDILYKHKDGRVVLADYKTPDMKGKDKFKPYSKWGYQLGAYDMAAFTTKHLPSVDDYQTILLPSDDFGRVYVHDWSQDKRWDTLKEMVELGIRAWRIEKDYPWTGL